MKRTVAFIALLMLLLQISLQQTEAAADSLKPSNPSDDLKHLKDIVYQQGTMLVELKTEMKYVEKENSVLKTKMAKQIKQGKQIQGNMEDMKNKVSAQAEAVSSTKSKLTSEVEKLKEQNEEIRTALANSQTEVKTLKKENTALKGRLSTAEGDVASLKREVIEHPKVAFSAALKSTMGSLSSDANIVYTSVITNIGGGYNPNTGIFTAPSRGVYYFRFTIMGSNTGYNTGIYMYKNQELLTFLWGYNYNSYGRYISGGFTLQLEIGDTVRTQLPNGYILYHQYANTNTFSGFMIFPI
ncbi:collagen alpha-2(VIII) chain-like [Astyanax mexicanus]|uniref:Collagen alpha-2(VIII) chain-like n=1 Tax=Astyanax mexicanus TaxID=7994 RepID=A0A8T2MCN4_ASTMX|nr:collagen alpha-2(VIII) chain-like [Astyanax mexicanus]